VAAGGSRRTGRARPLFPACGESLRFEERGIPVTIDRDNMRRKDFVSGIVLMLFGAWIVCETYAKVPMKGSWGGVMNVWYVSPGLFPIFIGSILFFFGAVLTAIAVKHIGFHSIRDWVRSRASVVVVSRGIPEPVFRFLAVVVILAFYIYMNMSRVDFYLNSIFFLVVIILIFYLDDAQIMRKLFGFYLAGSVLFLFYFYSGLDERLSGSIPYPADLLTILFTAAFSAYAWTLARHSRDRVRKCRQALFMALATPLLIGGLFKYFLLVPLPKEGLVVALMDAVYFGLF
jgi:hypothetical protein